MVESICYWTMVSQASLMDSAGSLILTWIDDYPLDGVQQSVMCCMGLLRMYGLTLATVWSVHNILR